MTADQINRYRKVTTPRLRIKAAARFRAMIRKRDEGNCCISCGSPHPNQAGHYYSAGHYPELEFNPDNVHLQCTRCNMYLSGNLIEYRKGLIRKIGGDRVEQLDTIVAIYKHTGYKHDRLNLIEILNGKP